MPRNERERIEKLRSYAILDTEPEAAYDDFTRLAALICDVPIALISLVDEQRQWFKSRHGLEALETDREHAFCAHTIMGGGIFVVQDATTDPRFSDNPLVTGEPDIRFYAGAPLTAPDGHRVGSICAIDRVPRELSESQLEALEALARQVVVRLEMRRLLREFKDARQLADEASRAKSRSLAAMSHEIRTPLNAILGFAELLARDQSLNEQQRDYLQTIRSSGAGLLSLINGVLDIARIEAGKIDLKLAAFEAESVLSEIYRMFQLQVADRPIHLSLNATGLSGWTFMGDADKIRQILINLTNNAVKFTESGSITLHGRIVGTGSSDGSTQLVELAVEDTGCGIDADDLNSVFEEFFRSKVHGDVEGTGLGLPLCRRLAELMGGTLEASSEPGQGSIFCLVVPLGVADAISDSRRTGQSPIGEPDSVSLNGAKISATLRAAIAEAAEAADLDRLGELLGDVAEQDENASRILGSLLADYKFDVIRQVVDRSS